MRVARLALLLTLGALAVGPMSAAMPPPDDAPASASHTGPVHQRSVERVVATPTPLGPLTLLEDDARWRIDVPAGAVVVIDAEARAPHALFYLTWRLHHQAEPDPGFPATRHMATLPGPATWHVSVDPAGGAEFVAHVRFSGHVFDKDSASRDITLTDERNSGACVLPGVCLP